MDRIRITITFLAQIIIALLVASCAQRSSPTHSSFKTFEDFQSALSLAVESGEIESFWAQIRQTPLIYDDTAIFLYRGEAISMFWSADFAPGDKSLELLPMERQGDTDIWILQHHFPLDARFNYRIAINGHDKILDPFNPYQNIEESGPVSELRMPDYIPDEIVSPRKSINHGALSNDTMIFSEILDYEVNYKVYTPYGYENLQGLPSIYVVDGLQYADNDLGSMVTVLDNLIHEGSIQPVIAVFIDRLDPKTGLNRREEEFDLPTTFDQFIVKELVPIIDQSYQTKPLSGSRAILGCSLGGIFAFHVGIAHPETFNLIAAQSPAPRLPRVHATWLRNQRDELPLKFFISVGTIGDVTDPANSMREILEEEGYPLLFIETNDGHAWGNYRRHIDELLLFFFSVE
jgi:enterochelin esterase-like enzyme